jgi:hypothetical protein
MQHLVSMHKDYTNYPNANEINAEFENDKLPEGEDVTSAPVINNDPSTTNNPD